MRTSRGKVRTRRKPGRWSGNCPCHIIRNCEVGRRRGSRCLPASQQLLIPLLFGRDVICHQRTRYAMTLSSSRLQLPDGFLKCVDQPDRNLFDVPVQAPNGFQIGSHNGILDVENNRGGPWCAGGHLPGSSSPGARTIAGFQCRSVSQRETTQGYFMLRPVRRIRGA